MPKAKSGPWESISASITVEEISDQSCFAISARVWSQAYSGWRTMTVMVARDRISADHGGTGDPYRTPRQDGAARLLRWNEIMRMLVRDLELWDPK